MFWASRAACLTRIWAEERRATPCGYLSRIRLSPIEFISLFYKHYVHNKVALTTVLITDNRPGTDLGSFVLFLSLHFIWQASFPCAEFRRQPPPRGPLWVERSVIFRETCVSIVFS